MDTEYADQIMLGHTPVKKYIEDECPLLQAQVERLRESYNFTGLTPLQVCRLLQKNLNLPEIDQTVSPHITMELWESELRKRA